MHLHINSLVALRDLEGLPVVSKLPPYFLGDLLSNDSLMLFRFKFFTLSWVLLEAALTLGFLTVTIGGGAGFKGCSIYLRSKIIEETE